MTVALTSTAGLELHTPALQEALPRAWKEAPALDIGTENNTTVTIGAGIHPSGHCHSAGLGGFLDKISSSFSVSGRVCKLKSKDYAC